MRVTARSRSSLTDACQVLAAVQPRRPCPSGVHRAAFACTKLSVPELTIVDLPRSWHLSTLSCRPANCLLGAGALSPSAPPHFAPRH